MENERGFSGRGNHAMLDELERQIVSLIFVKVYLFFNFHFFCGS